ncbi:hypothetical protein GUJ93_ZPchr0009g680 [Zizania palustris]|uniref:Uncharacterized protein n=1 Tax=Zizania palustris TaxID=103762 RepID=A0A8J5S0D5_ZIZPA|nr:hypothetical protein GUJ93_ZPchr0009g680 [Zizania palustris]
MYILSRVGVLFGEASLSKLCIVVDSYFFYEMQKTRSRRRRRARTTGTEAGKKNKALKVKKKMMKKKPRARDSEGRLAKSTPRRKKTACYPPPRDSKGRFLPKGSTGSSSDTEDNYNGYMNAQPPDFATILSIMHGKEGMKYCNRIRRLKDPDFVPLMNVINNSGHQTVDEGPYDVVKVLMRADCSVE